MTVTKQYLLDLLDRNRTLCLQKFKCGLSEHLLFRPAIHPFRALIPVSNPAVHIPDKDRICNEFQELRMIEVGPCGLFPLSKVFKRKADALIRQGVKSRGENAVAPFLLTV